ncbi:hypothetical protein [Klebsiella pneumoniae]|uniref:hypothetical protein n=1 Tax=Klebsiella pneumoniae TaxID=573 RepID=UPI000F2C9D84|nr:hypothetical protein [Klebsiella pneumoniae]VDB02837.1 hypothetical protein BANRA_05769 [Klebsiella pneumoniae]
MLTLTDIRASNTVLVTEFGGVRAVHFCLHEKLSGSDNDLWFPLANGADLFEALESIMCINLPLLTLSRWSSCGRTGSAKTTGSPTTRPNSSH